MEYETYTEGNTGKMLLRGNLSILSSLAQLIPSIPRFVKDLCFIKTDLGLLKEYFPGFAKDFSKKGWSERSQSLYLLIT
jgi:hypothetical protein